MNHEIVKKINQALAAGAPIKILIGEAAYDPADALGVLGDAASQKARSACRRAAQAQARALAATHAPAAIEQLREMMQTEKPDTRVRVLLGLLKLGLPACKPARVSAKVAAEKDHPPVTEQDIESFGKMLDNWRSTRPTA